jgi:hypothetical protein
VDSSTITTDEFWPTLNLPNRLFPLATTEAATTLAKSSDYTELSGGFTETVVDYVDPLPSSYTTAYPDWMQGAIAEADRDATAFPHRDKLFSFTISSMWSEPERDDELVA